VTDDRGEGSEGDARDAPRVDRVADALETFGGSEGERLAVARAARDLADSGRLRADRGTPLTADRLVGELRDAPGGGPARRWNWWVGALDLAYGGYARFGVRRYAETDTDTDTDTDDGEREDGGGTAGP